MGDPYRLCLLALNMNDLVFDTETSNVAELEEKSGAYGYEIRICI